MSTFGLAFTSALVDFVWQGVLVALVLLAALHTLGRRSAQVRYGLCLLALATLMALPVITTASRFKGTDFVRGGLVTGRPITVVADTGKGLRVEALIRSGTAPSVVSTLQPWILPIWSFGVLLLSLRLVAGGLEVRALRRSITAADDLLRDRGARVASRIGLRRAVQIGISTRADGPSVIGWLRPLILLPPATLMGLTPTQLDAVLAHELAHIRRHDYLVDIFQMVAETLLFYHPAVWWVSHRLRIERELCCDDEAVRVCGDATAYARALVTMAKLQVPAMAMGSTGGSLSDRIRRLLGVSRREPSRSAPWRVVVIGVALLSVTLANVGAQTKPVRFEVASIKPAPPGASLFSNVEFLPGDVVRGDAVPVFALVAAAYDVPWRVVESESPVMNERFAVEARAGAGALPRDAGTFQRTQAGQTRVMREMLKTLLAERFRLALHVEKREFPMYALRVGANGHKLTPTARDCAPKTATDASRGDALCGVQVDTPPLAMAALYGSPGDGLRLRGSDMSDLASILGTLLDRMVVDRTGIAGRFDIDVPPWSLGLQPRPSDLGPDAEPQPDPNGPSIFSVIQKFGLRLEATRGQIEILVVDHVEPPTAN